MNDTNQSTASPPPKFHPLPLRTFVVRKYSAARDVMTLTVHAHCVIPLAGGMVEFVDLERGDPEPAMHIHRIVYNVEDVEEILRTSPSSSSLITH